MSRSHSLDFDPDRAAAPWPFELRLDRLVAGGIHGFALFTILYHVALAAGWPFSRLAVVTLLVLVAAMPGAFAALRRGKPLSDRRWVGLALALLIAVGAALSLFTVRPDADDVSHMAAAVEKAEHPSERVDWTETIAFRSGDRSELSSLTSQEHLTAVVADWTGLRPIDVLHFGGSLVGGALVPLAWFLFGLRARRGAGDAALVGALAVVLYLCLDGSVHRSLGNFAFVRIWQGKALFVSAIVPLVLAALWDVSVERRRRPGIVRLLSLSVAGLGLTTSAIFLLPILFIGFAVCLWVVRRPRWGDFGVAGLVLVAYPIARGFGLWLSTLRDPSNAIAGGFYPTELGEAARFVYGSFWGVPLAAAAVAAVLLWLARERRWLVGLATWGVVLALPLAIPTWSVWFATHFTTQWVFWRIVFVLPLPTALAVAVTLFVGRHPRLAAGATAVLVTVVVAIPWFPPRFSPWAGEEVEFPVWRLKFPAPDLAVSEAVAENLQPGPIVAPLRIARTLPALTADFPPMSFRGYRYLTIENSPPEELAFRYLSGTLPASEKTLGALAALVERPFRYVLLEPESARDPQLVEILEHAGYRRVAFPIAGIVVFGR